MKTGSYGTFVISWAQTELDGVRAAPVEALLVGSHWRWSGEALRVDRATDLLVLRNPESEAEIHRRAARSVRRLLGAAIAREPEPGREDADADDDALPEEGFSVTDGQRLYMVTVITDPATAARLLIFATEVPPADTDLWVVDSSVETGRATLRGAAGRPGVICFTPGTRLLTPEGPRPIEDLAPGDRISTRDDGPQEILWVGSRRMSGARLYAMPHLRPIRIREGALGEGRPEGDLLVSPQHRLLVRGAAARALFNLPEVLVAAEDLVDGRGVHVDHALTEVSYVHILLERHQIVWANGVEAESFHPGNTTLEMLDPGQRAALVELFPELAEDPARYGDFARRNLSRAEAAILRHEAA